MPHEEVTTMSTTLASAAGTVARRDVAERTVNGAETPPKETVEA
jgi:hypothetical protein